MRASHGPRPANLVYGACKLFNEHLRARFPEAPISVSDEPLVMNSLLNTARLRETLDFTPRYTVEEGIALYIEDVKRRERA